MSSSIHITEAVLGQIRTHLFRPFDKREQGGFLICAFDKTTSNFDGIEWVPLQHNDYIEHKNDYLEMSDEARGRIIKKAHDMKASLVEIHSHPGPAKAVFSIADYIGFEEFVPHVWWRLKKRPYAALVFAYDSVDGFCWIEQSSSPSAVRAIVTEQAEYSVTGLSFQALKRGFYESIR